MIMKIKIIQIPFASLFILALFCAACGKDENSSPFVSYPVVYSYDHLAMQPTLWYVLTTGAYTQIAEPAAVFGFDTELKSILESDFGVPEFNRLEFLSDTSVRVTFTSSGTNFDTILPYRIESGRTKIQFNATPEFFLVFREGAEPNTLEFGMVTTIHSYIKPNGVVDYSATDSQFSDELDAIKILNALRMNENLMVGDTVGVNRAAYVFK
jgi:hypothetical protein